ncbi:MAG: GMC family oxidoreductase [archaeon]|nr:GMC family oxidoreductase [archaeon]
MYTLFGGRVSKHSSSCKDYDSLTRQSKEDASHYIFSIRAFPHLSPIMSLTERQRRTLRAVAETIVPSIDASSDEFYRRSANDLGVGNALAEIIETRLEPPLREQFQRLLNILESPTFNLMLVGKPVRFSDLRALEDRTKYLANWRDSRLGSKRMGFQALKRLACFLFYTLITDNGINPNWNDIGYPGPREKFPLSHPEGARIKPIEVQGDDTKLNCDVCVVGSGAGGSVIAYELSKAGFDVLVVEAGGYETSETFDQSELSMMNRLFDEYGTASTSDLSFVLLSGRAAGGGTTVNWMTCIKPPMEVLKDWESTYGIAGLSGPDFQSEIADVWDTLKVNLSESQRNGNNEVLWRGCNTLGYKEGVDYSQIFRNALDCRERCAYCTYGCSYSCKQSTLLNYLPMAFKNGAKFLFNVKVERVVVENGIARGVEGKFIAANGAGRRSYDLKISSKVVVVACGSIKTPALLLKSGIRNKNVGKNLRLHPTTAVSGHFKEEIRAWDGPPQTVVVTKFLNSDGGSHGFWIEAAPTHPGLFALSSPWPDGKSHKEYMRKWFNRSSANIVLLKEWGSGQVSIDKRGYAKVSYHLDNKDKQNMTRGMTETARILVAAGAIGLSSLHSDWRTDIIKEEPLRQNDLDAFSDQIERKGIESNKIMLFSAHLMGSCRMSSDESLGAVNQEGEIYGVRNLFVSDGSVFPTTLGVNPMITIMSLSKRTAKFVAKRLGSV